MYEIKKIQNADFERIKSFLGEVPDLTDFDDDVLKNALILFKNDKIEGVISYEHFFNYALIRYFVFKRSVEDIVIKELFTALEESITDQTIEYIFSLVNNNDVYKLFSMLGFVEANKEDVFVEEVSFENPKFKDTKLMIKRVKN